MAGIAGALGRGPLLEAIAPLLEALRHRGEDAGVAALRRGAVGQRGGAPFCDTRAGLALAFDGALYNAPALRRDLALRGFRFAGDSDAETLVRAYQHWDKDVAKHLRGAFAFALWDQRKERLLLARDRFGEKPLYLLERGENIYFASEARALLRVPGFSSALDGEAVRACLAHRYVPGPGTLIAGVRKLLPGSAAVWQFGRLHELRYWLPPDHEPAGRPQAGDPVAAFTERLEEAVRLQGAGAPRPGLLLSGGIDSAVLLALMTKQAGGVKTFTAGVQEDRDSELPRAAELAKHFGAEHHELSLSRADLAARLPAVIASRDAPVARPWDIILHFLVREAARSVGAVLSGVGADELLGGARRHVALHLGFGRSPETAPEMKPGASRLRRALYLEQTRALPDGLLEPAERVAAAASLQLRAPYLDHHLAELVSSLDDGARVRGLTGKWLLRQAAQRLEAGREARRPGLGIPLEGLLRGELRELLVDHLRGARSVTRAYYDEKALDRALEGHLRGKRDNDSLLWTLLNLEIWHRTYSAP